MELLVVLLIGLVIWLWLQLSRLSERVERLDERLIRAIDTLRGMERDANKRPSHKAQPVESPAPPEPVSVPLPAPVVASADPMPTAAARLGAPRPRIERIVPAESAEPAPPAAPVEPGEPAEPVSWELTVGTSWLNKIGVLTLVIGVALLVAYSFPLMGPAGRVATGYVLSGVILAAGMFFERREQFRNYGYGLVAGGWAGVYFTTFAMHEVPAARILESDLVAVSLLSVVAVGMIAHSLRYRSQVVTSLAYVVAYATLALSPLSGFSLAASVPLAVSVLFVSQRLGWPAVSTLGIVATYLVFVLRASVFPGGAMSTYSPLPYLTLAAYWLAFEIADIAALRMRRTAPGGKPQLSMLALNAAGLLGSLVVMAPVGRPQLFAAMLFSTGAAYIVSAVIRALLMPERRHDLDADRPFDGSHAATAIAAFLFVAAILLRFSQTREGLGWLLETQLLFVAGLTLGDRWLRRFGSAIGALVTTHTAILCIVNRGGIEEMLPGIGLNAAIAIVVAMIWYANRETLRIRSLSPAWIERGYSWCATGLVGAAIWASASPAHQGLAGILAAFLLLEAGLRRDSDYTWQSYLAGALGGYATLGAFLFPPDAAGQLGSWGIAPAPLDDWIVLPVGIAVCASAAFRLLTHRGAPAAPEAVTAAGTFMTLAAALTMVFEWRVLPAEFVAPAWAATGFALAALGLHRHQTGQRWLGYAVTVAASIRITDGLFAVTHVDARHGWAAGSVAALVYATAWLARRSAVRGLDKVNLGGGLSVVGTLIVSVLQWRILQDVAIGPGWTLLGATLLFIGLGRSLRDLRWQGYVMLALGTLRAGLPVFGRPEATFYPIVWLSFCLAIVYVTTLIARRALRSRLESAAVRQNEDFAITSLLVGASAMLARLITRSVEPSVVTLALGLEGLALMSTGLFSRERALRLAGLTLLVGCIVKLFFFDLRELEPIPRIFSFVVLGLVLLGISWAYTQYRDKIRQLL
jgi:hypothetical protein